jgi:hypothetical protein
MTEIIGLFFILSGFIVGLGAVTVIDLHGFFAQRSKYWTEATTRTHKITKPLIWLGLMMILFGGILFYSNTANRSDLFIYQLMLLIPMLLNGLFLSFWVSPYILKKEKAGKAAEILPITVQRKIFISMLVSFFGWWSQVLLFLYNISLLIGL